MAGNHHPLPRNSAMMIDAFHHGVEQPGSDDIMRLGPQIHGCVLIRKIVFSLMNPVSGNFRCDGRGRPRVQHICFSGKLRRAAGTWNCWFINCGINRKVFDSGKDMLLAFVASPDGDGNAKVPLPGDAPVPIQILHPVIVADFHVRGVPGDGIGSVKQFLFPIQNFDVPLFGFQEFNRRLAAFMHIDGMGYFLLLRYQFHFLEFAENRFPRFGDFHSFEFFCKVIHPAMFFKHHSQWKVEAEPFVNIFFIPKCADHH